MNRSIEDVRPDELAVPRARGDEPFDGAGFSALQPLFPAHAGMNRPHATLAAHWPAVPRARGDEPSLPVLS